MSVPITADEQAQARQLHDAELTKGPLMHAVQNHMDEPLANKLVNSRPYPDETAFARFAQSYTDSVLRLMQAKGQQYQDGGRREPAWANYEEMAAFMHDTTASEIVHAMMKHLWVIARWSAGSNHTKDIGERIRDVVVYLLLLAFWQEQHEEP